MTLNSEFSTGNNLSNNHGTAANPYAMDGGSMTHSYNDNDKINTGRVTTATNASQWGGNMGDTHRQLENTVLNKLQTLSIGSTSVDTTPSYQISSALDTPQPAFDVPTSGSGAAAGAGITGAGGSGL